MTDYTWKEELLSDEVHDSILELQTNIDDCSGEVMGFVLEELFAAGARDAFYTPIFMKKNRPAYLLTVLCMPKDRRAMERIIFTHTTSIGIRCCEKERTILPRKKLSAETPYGTVLAKACRYEETTFIYPEYESVQMLCRKHGMSYEQAVAYVKEQFIK